MEPLGSERFIALPLPRKSPAEISHEVKWPMGEKASGGDQNGRNALTSRLMGGALKAVRSDSGIRQTTLPNPRQDSSGQRDALKRTHNVVRPLFGEEAFVVTGAEVP
jgi:hypothetical protein